MGPQPTAEETLQTHAGLALHCERFSPAAEVRAAALVVHGFSSHCGLFRHVAAALAGAGFATLTFDCQGHGRSAGRRGYVRRFSDFGDDLVLAMERARAAAPGRPFYLVTHSQGSAIALDVLLSGRGTADLLVAAAPYLGLRLKVPAYKLALSRLLGGVWPTVTMANGLRPRDVSRNPDVWAGMDTDPLVHHVATPRWFNEVRAAQARILAQAAALRVPTLMLLAGGDRIVDNQVALGFARDAGPIVEVKQYEGLFHEIFLEPERDQVIADVIAWLVARRPI
jgi:alpha-beta hydrolase superfamily lysophospholipase